MGQEVMGEPADTSDVDLCTTVSNITLVGSDGPDA